MRKISLKAKTLQRLSTLSTFTTDHLLKCLRIEIKNKKLFVITTNGVVGIIEYVDNVDLADDVCHIRLTDKLVAHLEHLAISGEYVTVETIPELATGMLNGFTDCFLWPDETPLNKWHEWLHVADESKGFMYWDIYQVQSMFETSPTGKIVFPEVIDSSKPVILRDVGSNKWLGVFIPSPFENDDLKAAELPDWLGV